MPPAKACRVFLGAAEPKSLALNSEEERSILSAVDTPAAFYPPTPPLHRCGSPLGPTSADNSAEQKPLSLLRALGEAARPQVGAVLTLLTMTGSVSRGPASSSPGDKTVSQVDS